MNFSWDATQGCVAKPTLRLKQGEQAGMDAVCRQRRFSLRWIASCVLVLCCSTADAASQRTQNFIIQAPTPQLAQAVAEAAERYRRDLAMHWLGKTLPAWPRPCPIRVVAGPRLAAQGVTTYNPAPVRDFQMEVIGTPQRILDSVLPHEITHTILATYFGRPLPRWADEGICTTVEHSAERKKHEAKLQEFLRSRRGIAMNQLFLLKEYPNDVLPMYAQGYSVCRFLINQQGPRTFIKFLEDYMRHPSWTDNIRQHYGYNSLAELQQYWLAWVSEGCGEVTKYAKNPATPGAGQLAVNTAPVNNSDRNDSISKNNSPQNVSLAAGQTSSRSNSYQSVVQASQNQQPDMKLQSPSVNQVALNAPTAGTAAEDAATAALNNTAKPQNNVRLPADRLHPADTAQPADTALNPITNLASIENTPAAQYQPAPTEVAATATEAIKGYYQNQQLQAQTQRQNQSENGLSQVTIPMVPPSIRLSGKYGLIPVAARAAFGPATRLGQASLATASGQAGQANVAPDSSNKTKQVSTTPQFLPAESYQTAHPQPEQRIAPGGQSVPVSPAGPSQHSRLGTPKRY